MLKELLGDELYSQVTEKLGDKKIMVDDGNFIPKSRFDQVNQAKKDLEVQLKDRDTQLADLSKNNKDNESLLNQIKDLQALNKQTTTDYESKINQMKFDHALEGALNNAKCKNSKALRALLDIDNVKLNEGKLEGLEEQLNKLKESDSYLFDLETTPANTGGLGNFGRSGAEVNMFDFNFQSLK
ncbi:phage scaffolding protein [Romboutsia ilealis]|uniref:phage scaffolding protein n=1 Tax=Romboutsia ilealis TaxID=1115758 RepID=UPI0025B76E18|nr:phage scaffolding protein [Romboutsia ilealis]